MTRAAVTVLFALIACAAIAQDRDGRDTAGSWAPTHADHFDEWDLVCDERVTGNLKEERCYLRYVEVYSQAPEFGAVFSFVNATSDGLTLDFGLERGTRFAPEGFRLMKSDIPVWVRDDTQCLRRRDCMMDPIQAAPVLKLMADADRLEFAFTDRHGNTRDLAWEMGRFSEALTALNAQAALRSLQ